MVFFLLLMVHHIAPQIGVRTSSYRPTAHIDDSPMLSAGIIAARMMQVEPEKKPWWGITKGLHAHGIIDTPGAGFYHLSLLSRELQAVYKGSWQSLLVQLSLTMPIRQYDHPPPVLNITAIHPSHVIIVSPVPLVSTKPLSSHGRKAHAVPSHVTGATRSCSPLLIPSARRQYDPLLSHGVPLISRA